MPNSDVSEKVVIALRKIMRSVDLHSRSLAQRHGLTGPQLMLLRTIGAGSSTLGDLSRKVSLSNATVTGITDRLEKGALVVRERSGRDRRQVMVRLTETGMKKLNTAPPLLQERFLRQLDDLKDRERAQILSVLERVAAMMDADKLDVSPLLESSPLDISTQALIDSEQAQESDLSNSDSEKP